MSKKHLCKRVFTFLVLGMTAWGLSACYRDAGENVQPTSNRVDLNDIVPTTAAPPTALSTATPTPGPAITATRTLIPTTTPPGGADLNPPVATATSIIVSGPSNTPQFAPSFTPVVSATPAGAGIETPGMSDIQPSITPAPTLNPALQPTPTSIPVDQNPCIHVVQSGDTLYSIARDDEVEIDALVAANPTIFGGNPNTILQIGWELQLPGCGTEEPTAQPTSSETGTPGAEVQPTAASGTVTHVVQSGEGIYSIARQYGVDPQVIIDANNLTNPNLIHPGDTLIIPLGQ